MQKKMDQESPVMPQWMQIKGNKPEDIFKSQSFISSLAVFIIKFRKRRQLYSLIKIKIRINLFSQQETSDTTYLQEKMLILIQKILKKNLKSFLIGRKKNQPKIMLIKLEFRQVY